MGKWASKHSRSGSSRKSSQKSQRVYSTSHEDEEYKSSPSSSAEFQHNDAVTCLESWDRKLCVSGSCDGTILLQDLNERKIINQTWKHEKEVTKVRIKGSNVLSASRDKSIKIWKAGVNMEKGQLLGHTLAVTAISFEEQFSQLYSGSRDNSVKIWDLTTLSCIAESKISRNLVTDICVSSQQGVAIQTSEDRIIKLWDSRNLQVVHSFPTQNQIQTSCDVSGNLFTTTNNGFGGRGCEICLWDLRERKLLQTLRGHTETVSSCKFINNHQLVSCSHDGTVKLWNVQENNVADLCSSLPINCGNLLCLTAIDANNILCGSFDKGILHINIRINKLYYR